MPNSSPKYLLLGEILRPHGVKGELRLRLLTDYPERISKLKTVYLGGDPDDPEVKSYRVQHMRMNQDYGLLKLTGIEDRDQADLLRELFVMVDIKHAVPLEEDEVYLYQLIGLRVQSDSGEELGVLREVLETGANDVYVVDSPAYGEILIPVTEETIVKTDPEAGVMIVHLLDGLLPPK
jgi:16S rRNA processing protein RimM